MNESQKIGKLLKKSLELVDELGNLDFDDFNVQNIAQLDLEKLEELIKKANELKQNYLWKLK